MQSIILAAGLGSRLGELTKECTKCMVKINGITLIERMLRQLDRYGMDRIIIVTGYKGDILKDYVQNLRINTPVVFVDNSDYRHTNNIYSLWLTREFLEEMDSLVLESDMIFEDRVIEKMLAIDNGCGTFVARPRPWMDGSIVKLDKDNNIVYFVDDEERKCIPTDYAIAQGVYISDEHSVNGTATCWWWLRSPGYIQSCATLVYADGVFSERGYDVDRSCSAVRPAMWITIE